MKVKLACFVLLLILILTLFVCCSFVSAESNMLVPESVRVFEYMDSDSYPEDSFWNDTTSKYNSFFSPYSTQPVDISGVYSLFLVYHLVGDLYTGSLSNLELWDICYDSISSQFDLIVVTGNELYQYHSLSLDGYVYSDAKNSHVVIYMDVDVVLDGSVSAGSMAYYNLSDYEVYMFTCEIPQFKSICPDIKNLVPYAIDYHCQYNVQYDFNQIVTSTSFLTYFQSVATFNSNETLLQPVDYYVTFNCNDVYLFVDSDLNIPGGVFDVQFTQPLRTTVFDFETFISSSYYGFNSQEQELFDVPGFDISLGKMIPYSENIAYTGGVDYGDWQSTSCSTFDIPCHLGNAIGYLIYEFPLTKPITDLFTPLLVFFDTNFDVLQSFSGAGIVYAAIVAIVVGSIIFYFASS